MSCLLSNEASVARMSPAIRDRLREQLFLLTGSDELPTELITSEEQLDDAQHLQRWGFSTNHCSCCGIHNSQIEGRLIQCARCKKAYYCSPKCYNEHLPVHSQKCRAGVLHQSPKKADVSSPKITKEGIKAEIMVGEVRTPPSPSKQKVKKAKSPRKSPSKPSTSKKSPRKMKSIALGDNVHSPPDSEKKKRSPGKTPKKTPKKKTPTTTPKTSNSALKRPITLPEVPSLDDPPMASTTDYEKIRKFLARADGSKAKGSREMKETTKPLTIHSSEASKQVPSRVPIETIEVPPVDEADGSVEVTMTDDETIEETATAVEHVDNVESGEASVVSRDSTIEEVVIEYVDVVKKKRNKPKYIDAVASDDDDTTIVEYIFDYEKPAAPGEVINDRRHDTVGAKAGYASSRLLVLITSSTPHLHEVVNQQQAFRLLKSCQIIYDVMDGIDPGLKSEVKKLSDLSGRRDEYPQFFVKPKSGIVEFFGGWDEFEEAKKNGRLVDVFGELAVPDS